MQNLIWLISIRQENRPFGSSFGKLQYFVTKGKEFSLKIGSSLSHDDIFVNQAFPSHVIAEIKNNALVIKASKKLIYTVNEKSQMLSKGKFVTVPFEILKNSNELEITFKFKGTNITNQFFLDTNILENWPDVYEKFSTKYHSLVKVAEGNTSFIYKNDNEEPCFLRILNPDYKDKETLEKFAQLQKAKDFCSYSLPILEVIDDPVLAYKCQYFEGQSLYQLVISNQKKFEQLFASLFYGLVDFLQELHKQNKIHGDLNPHNILLDDSGNFRVVGWGNMTSVSPHISRDVNTIQDFRTDIRALGEILYFSLMAQEIQRKQGDFSLSSLQFSPQALPYKKTIVACLQGKITKLETFLNNFKSIQEDAKSVFVQDNDTSEEIYKEKAIQAIPQEVDEEEEIRQNFRDYPDAPNIARIFGSKAFGKFDLEKALGEGPLATYWKAFDNEYSENVALKIFHKTDPSLENEVGKILHDVQAASTLDHPNILKPLEIGKEEGFFYIAMKYVDGKNLAQYMQQKVLTIKDILLLVRDIARAMQHAHIKGVLHRNIHLNNVIVDLEGRSYLSDFGFVAHLHEESNEQFLAPEVRKSISLSPLQDIYSLGIILQSLIDNKTMLRTEISSRTMSLTYLIPKLSEIPVEIHKICQKACAKNPRKRYPKAITLADDIERFLNYKPIMAKSTGFRLVEQISQSKWLFGIVLGLFLVSLFCAVLLKAPAKPSDDLQNIREKVLENHQAYKREYLMFLQDLPIYSKSEGYTEEVNAMFESVPQRFLSQQQRVYKQRLLAEILPTYSYLFQVSKKQQDKELLNEVLQEIISFCETTQEQLPFLEKMYSLQELQLPQNFEVTVETTPKEAELFLYCLEEDTEGKVQAVPFDLSKKQKIPRSEEQQMAFEKQQKLLSCQNLLFDSVDLITKQKYPEAEKLLQHVIEVRDDYIEAHFLLCCLYYIKRDKQNLQKYAVLAKDKIRQLVVPKEKQKHLNKKFSKGFVHRISSLYRSLPIEDNHIQHFVKVVAVPEKSLLKPGDILYQVNSMAITSRKSLQHLIGTRDRAACLVIRNFRIQQLLLPGNFHMDSNFCTVEEPPIFFVHHNAPLTSQEHNLSYFLAQLPENKVNNNTTSLPIGKYLLTVHAERHQPIRYPFAIEAGSVDIKLRLVPGSFPDYAFIPGDKIAGTAQYSNTSGTMIARYETTMGDWLRYLQEVQGSLSHEQLLLQIPRDNNGTELFYIYQGVVHQSYGKRNWPVFGVSPQQIQHYLKWLKHKFPKELQHSLQLRLPTKEEWQAAAGNSKYTWGNFANPKFCKVKTSRKYIVHQESISPHNPTFVNDESLYGVYGMMGNVSEYVLVDENKYALKGASWNSLWPQEIEKTLYSVYAANPEECGFRVCFGVDSLLGNE